MTPEDDKDFIYLGPVLFSLYTTSLSQVITNYNLSRQPTDVPKLQNNQPHQPPQQSHVEDPTQQTQTSVYADDTQVYISLSQSNAQESVSTLSGCLTDILLWMESSKLKLNRDKTYLIIIGSKQQQNRVINHFPVKLLASDSFPSDTVRNLGTVFM